MDVSDPEIKFDQHGVCNHCQSYDQKIAQLETAGRLGEEHLHPLLTRVKAAGSRRKYDVVLGISGGADSAYLALLLRDWGVRTLLVHLDNGWDTQQALRNVFTVANTTGFDYESVVLDWEEFRDLQMAFLLASVVEAETPTDMAIVSALYGAAAKHGVKFIASASNEASEGILPRLWHYDATDLRYMKSIQRRFGTLKLRHFPLMSLKKQIEYRFARRIKTVYPLNYIDYDKRMALERLNHDLSWHEYGGKHHESLFTKFVQTVLLPRKFGFDYRRATLSTLICAGKVNREEALRRLEESCVDEANLQAEVDYVARKLRIRREELERIIASPPRYFYDYPNNERLLSGAYSVYRWVSRFAGAPARK